MFIECALTVERIQFEWDRLKSLVTHVLHALYDREQHRHKFESMFLSVYWILISAHTSERRSDVWTVIERLLARGL